MSLILNIDCAAETSLVQLVNDSAVLALETNPARGEHAAFLHPAIARLLAQCHKEISHIDAVAVTEGPGSYTGIRIGMATAKGICLATGKPLILLNRLLLMATAMKEVLSIQDGFYCPMMDARRMEVFCALYTSDIKEILKPNAHILSTVSFLEEVGENTLVISGSGAGKFEELSILPKVKHIAEPDLSRAFGALSYKSFLAENFSDLVDSQPFYAKDFYNG